MTAHTPSAEEDSLDAVLQLAVDQVRAEPVARESLARIEHQALSLANGSPASVAVADSAPGLWRRAAFPSAIAASLLLACVLLSSQLTASRAWAQVVEAVAAEPWMRLALQKPTTSLPADTEFPDVEIWLNGERTIAAVKSPSGVSWVDITNRQERYFDTKTRRIGIRALGEPSQGELEVLIAVIDCFQNGNLVGSSRTHKVLGSEEKSLAVEGQTLREFRFHLQRVKDNARHTMSVAIDNESKRPARVTWESDHGADAKLRRVFVADFPEIGPDDIYALGVSRGVPVDDLRALAEFFPERLPQTPSSYRATEIEVLAGWEGRWLNGVTKHQLTGGKLSTLAADPMQVVELAQEVRFGGGSEPDNSPRSFAWWISRVEDLDFTPAKSPGYNLPHNRCYAPYGGAKDYRSSHKSVLSGLEGTIELRGPRRSVWLDPERDLIVRRSETVASDGAISVSQYDEVVSDSRGNWFTTRWRKGRVAKRGDELADETAGVRTTVHLCDIRFE